MYIDIYIINIHQTVRKGKEYQNLSTIKDLISIQQ